MRPSEGTTMMRKAKQMLAATSLAVGCWLAESACADEFPQFRQQCLLKGHTGRVFAVEFSVDGKLIVSAGEDGSARIWDAATGEQKGILQGHKAKKTISPRSSCWTREAATFAWCGRQ